MIDAASKEVRTVDEPPRAPGNAAYPALKSFRHDQCPGLCNRRTAIVVGLFAYLVYELVFVVNIR